MNMKSEAVHIPTPEPKPVPGFASLVSSIRSVTAPVMKPLRHNHFSMIPRSTEASVYSVRVQTLHEKTLQCVNPNTYVQKNPNQFVFSFDPGQFICVSGFCWSSCTVDRRISCMWFDCLCSHCRTRPSKQPPKNLDQDRSWLQCCNYTQFSFPGSACQNPCISLFPDPAGRNSSQSRSGGKSYRLDLCEFISFWSCSLDTSFFTRQCVGYHDCFLKYCIKCTIQGKSRNTHFLQLWCAVYFSSFCAWRLIRVRNNAQKQNINSNRKKTTSDSIPDVHNSIQLLIRDTKCTSKTKKSI